MNGPPNSFTLKPLWRRPGARNTARAGGILPAYGCSAIVYGEQYEDHHLFPNRIEGRSRQKETERGPARRLQVFVEDGRMEI